MGWNREEYPDGVAGVVLGLKYGAGYKSLGKGNRALEETHALGQLEKRLRGGFKVKT